jgi:hypothetical protein
MNAGFLENDEKWSGMSGSVRCGEKDPREGVPLALSGVEC